MADGPIKFDYGQTGAGKLESTIDATAGIIVMINNDNYNNKKTDLCCKQRQKRDRQTNIQREREREKKKPGESLKCPRLSRTLRTKSALGFHIKDKNDNSNEMGGGKGGREEAAWGGLGGTMSLCLSTVTLEQLAHQKNSNQTF